MRVMTRKKEAKSAARRWRAQYKKYWDTPHELNESTKEKYERLVELGTDPNPDEVDRIIGNDSWTCVRCRECDKRVEKAVMVGKRLDDEYPMVCVCMGCLKAAVALMKEEA